MWTAVGWDVYGRVVLLMELKPWPKVLISPCGVVLLMELKPRLKILVSPQVAVRYVCCHGVETTVEGFG
jgi:hypothetical protein